MNIDNYLRRIGLDHRPQPDLAGLTALHRAHLQSIPYENLDVQWGHAVSTARAGDRESRGKAAGRLVL